MSPFRLPRRGVGIACFGLGAVLVMAACAENAGGGSGGGGEGVPYGATMEEYQEALADIDPIVIRAQSPSPEGSLTGAKFEGYMEAVEEWSGGTITFDVAYSNAIAPPDEVDDALADGRLDLGSVVLSMEPQDYPANAAFGSATQQGPNSLVLGTLISNAWWMDVTYGTPEIRQEAEDAGMFVINPAFNSGLITLNCAEPRTSLADFDGLQVITGLPGQVTAVENLGGSPTSMAYPEIFEALQRGIADCSLNSLLVSDLGGFTGEVPHITADPEAGFSSGPGAWAFSKQEWDSYPLVVQQLLFDRLDSFTVSNLESIWEVAEGVISDAEAAGGTFHVFDDDVRSSVQATGDEILEEVRASEAIDGAQFIDDVEASIEKWTVLITDELGFEDVEYEDFVDFYESGVFDLEGLTQAMYEEILAEHRPS